MLLILRFAPVEAAATSGAKHLPKFPTNDLLFRAYGPDHTGLNGHLGCKARRFLDVPFDEIPTPQQMGRKPARLRKEMRHTLNMESRKLPGFIPATSDLLRAIHICTHKLNGSGHILAIRASKLRKYYQVKRVFPEQLKLSEQEIFIWGHIRKDAIVGHCTYTELLSREVLSILPNFGYWKSLPRWREHVALREVGATEVATAINVAYAFGIDVTLDLALEILSKRNFHQQDTEILLAMLVEAGNRRMATDLQAKLAQLHVDSASLFRNLTLLGELLDFLFPSHGGPGEIAIEHVREACRCVLQIAQLYGIAT